MKRADKSRKIKDGLSLNTKTNAIHGKDVLNEMDGFFPEDLCHRLSVAEEDEIARSRNKKNRIHCH